MCVAYGVSLENRDLINCLINYRFLLHSASLAASIHSASPFLLADSASAIASTDAKCQSDCLCFLRSSVAFTQLLPGRLVQPPCATAGGLPCFLQKVQNMPSLSSSYLIQCHFAFQSGLYLKLLLCCLIFSVGVDSPGHFAAEPWDVEGPSSVLAASGARFQGVLMTNLSIAISYFYYCSSSMPCGKCS